MNPIDQALATIQSCSTLDEARMLTAIQYRYVIGEHDARWWWGVLVAESTSCWEIPGFGVLCDLLDDPPEREGEEN